MATYTWQAGLSVLALLLTGQVGANEVLQDRTARASTIEEVIVSSRRRIENAQTVPISVTAFNNDSIKARGLSSSADLANFTPNVQFDTTASFSGASSTFQGYIRAIGQDDFSITTDPGVGVYIDGVYIARTVGAVVDLLDVESIEILKGPQGTLFGRNSIGGAVNITTAAPAQEFGGKSELTLGSDGQVNVQGVVNIPIIDGALYSSLAFSVKSRDGYGDRLNYSGPDADNVTGLSQRFSVSETDGAHDPGAEDNQTFRLKLQYDNGGPLVSQLSVDTFRARDSAPPVTLADGGGAPNFAGSLAETYNACLAGSAPASLCGVSEIPYGVNGDVDPDNDQPTYGKNFVTGEKNSTYGTGPNFSDIDSSGASLTLNYDLSDALSLKSITSYRQMEMTSGLDGDASPLVIDHTTFTQDSEQISQEFQLNGDFGEVQFTGGLYYFHEEASETARVPLGGGLLLIATAIDHEVDSYAVFGEGTYNLTDKFSLNFGARYTEDEKSLYLDQENRTDFLLQVGIPPSLFPRDDTFFLSPAGELKASFDNFSVRAGANYQFTSDIFAYFTFSQGYKSGGFSTRLTAPVLPEDIDKMSYDPEEADTYELGLKSEFFDRRLRANLAVFSNDYNDIQVVVREGISPLVRNAGEATIRGAELELTALPIDQLRIDVGVGYTDAEYTSVLATAAPVTTESKFQNAPERTASAAVTYSVDMVSGSRFDVTGTASYRSKVYNDTTTSSEVIAQSGHTILGMQARYIAPDESWSFAVGGNDLTDKAPIIAGTYDTAVGYVPVIYSRGREYYARLSFNF